MRAIAIAGVILTLAAGSAASQTPNVGGQPTLLDPRPTIPNPQLAPAKSPSPTAPAKAAAPAKAPRAAAVAPSTPEGRSAAALALSADPVFDEGTYARLKAALLSYADIQVRGGWPSIPADAKLAPDASGPDVALLRRRLVISDDLAPDLEQGDV